jgi:hypothetical protein
LIFGLENIFVGLEFRNSQPKGHRVAFEIKISMGLDCSRRWVQVIVFDE